MLAGAAAVPIEPIAILDAIYDFGVPVVLIWYWVTFFKDVCKFASNTDPLRGDIASTSDPS